MEGQERVIISYGYNVYSYIQSDKGGDREQCSRVSTIHSIKLVNLYVYIIILNIKRGGYCIGCKNILCGKNEVS